MQSMHLEDLNPSTIHRWYLAQPAKLTCWWTLPSQLHPLSADQEPKKFYPLDSTLQDVANPLLFNRSQANSDYYP